MDKLKDDDKMEDVLKKVKFIIKFMMEVEEMFY